MKVLRILVMAVLVAVLALTVSGCGGDDEQSATTTTDTTTTDTTATTTTGADEESSGKGGGARATTVDMDEYSFDPENVQIRKGGTIDTENKGAIAHNLTIEKGPDPEKQSARLAGTRTFVPGNSESLEVNVDPGKYALVCTVPGHREQGMVGTLTVR